VDLRKKKGQAQIWQNSQEQTVFYNPEPKCTSIHASIQEEPSKTPFAAFGLFRADGEGWVE
jgi:hypothetical protein